MTVEELDALAMEHYSKGGDIFIECWERAEKQELLDEQGEGARAFALMLMENWHDRAEGIRNTAF